MKLSVEYVYSDTLSKDQLCSQKPAQRIVIGDFDQLWTGWIDSKEPIDLIGSLIHVIKFRIVKLAMPSLTKDEMDMRADIANIRFDKVELDGTDQEKRLFAPLPNALIQRTLNCIPEGTQGGNRARNPAYVKTAKKVKVGNVTRCIYQGSRGGKYIKMNGKMCSLKQIQTK